MKKLLLSFAILYSVTITAQDTVKVMTYNLLNYYNNTTYCTTTNNNPTAKDGYLRTIFAHEMPDIFAANEISGNGYTACKNILDNIININGITWYKRANYINSNNSDIISTLFYNSKKFTLYSQNYLVGGTRDILIYKLYYNSPDITTLNDTVFLTCVVMHLKAGSYPDDLTDRATETSILMNYLSGMPSMGNCLVMGDFNVQSSTEAGFQNLINYSLTNYRFYDPVSKLGTWNNNSSFADYHTQSTSSDVNNDCKASGGMDDRFDFILESFYIQNDVQKVKYVPGSYWAVGQDGNHYNQSINGVANYSVPSNVLSALANMSDHLPVVLKLKISQTPVIGVEENKAEQEFITCENPFSDNAHIQIYSSKTDTYFIYMYDQMGRLHFSKQYILYPGYNQIDIPVYNAVSGLYYLNIVNSVSNASIKLIKKQ